MFEPTSSCLMSAGVKVTFNKEVAGLVRWASDVKFRLPPRHAGTDAAIDLEGSSLAIKAEGNPVG